MALRDVRHTVTDGLLGFDTAKGEGVHLKIGVSPVVSMSPITMTGDMDAARIKDRLGLSPLADAVMDAVQWGANRVYCIPVTASIPGELGSVQKTGAGAGSITFEGSPANAFEVIVEITAQGGLNTAAFAVSIDGGYSFSDEITVPMSGAYELAGTGIKAVFSEAVGQEQDSFLPDDTYVVQSTAPAMTNADVLAAMARLRNFAQEYEFVHIVGGSDAALWQAVSEAQIELRDSHKKPVFVMLEAMYPSSDDTDLTNWALALEAEGKKVQNYDLQVVAAWGRIVRMDGTTQTVSLAGVVSGLYAKAAVQESIGKTRPSAGFGLSRARLWDLQPAGMDNAIIELLDKAGYLTVREYDGLADYYVYHTPMMCPDGSDYRYAEDVRPKNKIIRETRKEALLLLNDDIDTEDVQGELETRAKFLFAPLQRMIDRNEISAATIVVPEGQAQPFLESGTMRVKIRYLSRGHIREIEVDLGRSPATE